MIKINLFGDVRAEHDHEMLDRSFLESQNYRTLIESRDRFIVVGRRGTGKSALTYRLDKDWTARKFFTVVIAPKEEEVIGIRPLAELFGNSVTKIRAGIKLAWRYTLLLEVALIYQRYYKTTNEIDKYETLRAQIKIWTNSGSNPFERMRNTLRSRLQGTSNPEERIADLSSFLKLNDITEEVIKLTQSQSKKLVILIDRLDEGYEPDTIGVGIVDGIIYGTDELRNALGENLRAIVFLRDNIFRGVQTEDLDFSRNLESQVLRLHWDPEELFSMVCKRIRAALNIEVESDIKVWNSITSAELHGREGFKRCLRLTLYRPRDVIALLNAAIEQARRQNREKTLIENDFQESAKQISVIRFDDLGKEYASIFLGVSQLTTAFANGPTKFSVDFAIQTIKRIRDNPTLDADVLQHLIILGSEIDIAKELYGIGFFGMLDKQNSTWVFSHDGKRANKNISIGDSLMVHPCYWSALNLQKDDLEQGIAEQMFDDYEITIHSLTKEQRSSKLGQLISELGNLSLGLEDAFGFEDWCKRVIEIAFAKELTNIELHANKNATQQRDIVATNQGINGFWKRIREDYSTRQVIFEVKNFETIGIEEYRQMNGYLSKEYGKLGFIICRDKQPGLTKGRELEAFREFYLQDKLIIKISANSLTSILSKLRSPTKKDFGDAVLSKLLDDHIRLYSTGQSTKKPTTRRKKI
jgi:hypothetical protein